MTTHPIRIAAAVFLSLLLVLPALAEDVQWLRYNFNEQPWRAGIRGSVRIKVSTTCPEGLKLPKLEGTDARYGRWETPLVKGGVPFVLTKVGDAHNRLLFDTDLDGDLTDETVIKSTEGNASYARLPMFRLSLPSEDGPVDYHVSMYAYMQPKRLFVYMNSYNWYEGQVTIGGKTYECKLGDANVNGRYNDVTANLGASDRLKLNGVDHQAGKYVLVEGKFYLCEPSPDGATIRFTPATDLKTGTMHVPENASNVTLYGENGRFELAKPGDHAVPAGAYRLYSWMLNVKDAKGVKWSLRAYAPDRKLTFEEGKAVALAPEVTLKGTITDEAKGREHSLSYRLSGTNKEYVSLLRNGSQPPNPKMHIESEDGAYKRTFRLEYG